MPWVCAPQFPAICGQQSSAEWWGFCLNVVPSYQAYKKGAGAGAVMNRPGLKTLGKICQLGHFAGRQARADGIQGHVDTLFRSRCQTGHVNGSARVKSDHVPCLAADLVVVTAKRCPDQLQGLVGAIDRQAQQRLAFDTEILRGEVVFRDLAIFEFGNMGNRGQADFIQTVPGTDDHDVFGAQALHDLSHGAAQLAGEHPDQLAGNAGRVGHGPEYVEDGTAAQLPAGADGVLHGAVVGRGKHKAHADLLHAAGDLFGFHVQIDAGFLDQVGAAAFRRYAPVAMLGHVATGGGHYKGGGGGYVEQVGTIATGAHDIHQRAGIDGDTGGQLPHDFGGTGNLIDGFAFQTQAHQEGTDLGVCCFTVHHDAHDRFHFVPGQVQV